MQLSEEEKQFMEWAYDVSELPVAEVPATIRRQSDEDTEEAI